MSFSAIIGQHEVKERLGEALAAAPGHAYAFVGPKGIGKTLVAETFAAALLCRQPTPAGACGQCQDCRHFAGGTHPDYRRLSLQDKDKNIKVERVRRQVCADLSIKPQWGSRKVYLIDAEDLNETGQNALLKSLEEPPNHAHLLLTIDHFQRLLPTIRSRVIPLMLRRLSDHEIAGLLREKESPAAARPEFYARFSGGLPGMALDLADSEAFTSLRQETLRFFESLPGASRTNLLTQGYQFWDQSRSQADIMLDMLGSMLRDLMLMVVGSRNVQLTNEDERHMLMQQPVLKMPVREAIERLHRAHAALLKAQRGLAANASFEGLACQTMLALRKELHHA